MSKRYVAYKVETGQNQTVCAYRDNVLDVDFSRWRLTLLTQNKNTYRRTTYVGSFEVSVLAHLALHMLAAIFLASQ